MSTREYAKTLIDQIPDSKLIFIVNYLQGAALPDEVETPNAETLEAIQEVDQMIKDGTGEHFTGSTSDFLDQLLAEGWNRAETEHINQIQERLENLSEAAL